MVLFLIVPSVLLKERSFPGNDTQLYLNVVACSKPCLEHLTSMSLIWPSQWRGLSHNLNNNPFQLILLFLLLPHPPPHPTMPPKSEVLFFSYRAVLYTIGKPSKNVIQWLYLLYFDKGCLKKRPKLVIHITQQLGQIIKKNPDIAIV